MELYVLIESLQLLMMKVKQDACELLKCKLRLRIFKSLIYLHLL